MILRTSSCHFLLGSLGLVILGWAGQCRSASAGESIKAAVKQAKREGRSIITLTGPAASQPAISSFEDAIKVYSALVVQVDSHQSYIVDANSIGTWYQCRRIDVIARSTLVANGALDIPAELPRTGADLLLFVSGGSMVIDGVRVVSGLEGFPQLESGRRYLLFAAVDRTGRAAALYLGSAGVFELAQDGDLLIPFRGDQDTLREALAKRFGNSLSRLRNHLANPGVRQ